MTGTITDELCLIEESCQHPWAAHRDPGNGMACSLCGAPIWSPPPRPADMHWYGLQQIVTALAAREQADADRRHGSL